MSVLEIREHDFNSAKRKIKEFSEQTTTDLDLKRVDTSKGVGEWFGEWFKGGGIGTEHVVKGAELNALTTQIQKHLIEVNKVHRKIIGEFGQVYNALEGLDKGYIQAIVASIKATEKTSEGLNSTQKKLADSVDRQKETLEALKQFKKKMDGYAHLEDIDKLWTAYEKWHKDILSLSHSIGNITSVTEENAKKIDDLVEALKNTENKIYNLTANLNEQIAKLDPVIAFTSELERIAHLQDIDKMWESLADAHNALQQIYVELNASKEIIDKQQSNTDTLLHFMASVSSQVHLHDIDKMWGRTEIHDGKLDSLTQQSEVTFEIARNNQSEIVELSEYRSALDTITHLQDVDELWESSKAHAARLVELQKQSNDSAYLIQINKESIDSVIEEIIEKNNDTVQALTQKIKHAYLIAGGSLGLALIEVIILLMKVV